MERDNVGEDGETRIMTQKEYFERFHKVVDEMYKLTVRKNGDYADPKDAFANFHMIAALTDNRITVQDGIIVRITDKLKRICSLLTRDALVKDESIKDTIMDMAVYSIILYIWMSQHEPYQLQTKAEYSDEYKSFPKSQSGSAQGIDSTKGTLGYDPQGPLNAYRKDP